MLKRLSIGVLAVVFVSLLILALLHYGSSRTESDEALEPPEKLPDTFQFTNFPFGKPSFEFEGPFPKMPDKMMVYKVIPPENITEAYARELAQKYFGIPADAKLRRSSSLGLYWLKTSTHRFQLDPSNGFFNVRKIKSPDPRTATKEDYPTEEESKRIAIEYLKKHNLLPDDSSFSGVIDNTQGSGVMSVGFRRIIDGYKTWGAGARILVHIGPVGEIVKALKHWQQLIPYKTYPIKTPQQALQELRQAKGYLMGSKGKVNEITLRYRTSPDREKEYVQPVYFFDCTGAEGDFYAVVPAIRQEYLKSKEEMRKELEEERSRGKSRAT